MTKETYQVFRIQQISIGWAVCRYKLEMLGSGKEEEVEDSETILIRVSRTTFDKLWANYKGDSDQIGEYLWYEEQANRKRLENSKIYEKITKGFK